MEINATRVPGPQKIMKSRSKKPAGGKIRIRKGIDLDKYELSKFRVWEKDTVVREQNQKHKE
jgi:hypothetical protein